MNDKRLWYTLLFLENLPPEHVVVEGRWRIDPVNGKISGPDVVARVRSEEEAHLFAASKDLLDACLMMVGGQYPDDDPRHALPHGDQIERAILAAREAIKKARGQFK